ncbi:hypothetical protein GCM10012283_21600 [Phycicoccus endophyticus]|nr:hypothetical protein GCM10012283_21600 [Phycicoccus endophyticus]
MTAIPVTPTCACPGLVLGVGAASLSVTGSPFLGCLDPFRGPAEGQQAPAARSSHAGRPG